jgi:hypothetical protein
MTQQIHIDEKVLTALRLIASNSVVIDDEFQSAYYVGGTLCIDFVNGDFALVNIMEIDGCMTGLEHEAMFLASSIYMREKTEKHHFFQTASLNVSTYRGD